MKAAEIMTASVECVEPSATLVEIAERMLKADVGSLPVCDKGRLVGMVTDRDIVVRAIALGRKPGEARAKDVMTDGIIFGFSDQPVEEIANTMEKHQVRRLPVLDRKHQLVGVISTADLALHADRETTGEVIQNVSAPIPPDPIS